MNEKNRWIIILILGLLCTIGPFSIDMYLPGFPAIAKDLGVSVDMVSYSLSSYFIGVSLGQLLWGPLLDRFGRKGPLYIGLVLYVIATIGCALATTVEVLIGLRFFQALGGCVGIVAPRAMIRDFFPVEENAKIFSILILILGVSPILAPTIGGYTVAHLGWHAVFIILAVISTLILLICIFFLPESTGPDLSYSLKPRPILKKFKSVLQIKTFVIYSLSAAFSSAALFAYLSGSPYVFMDLYQVSEKNYGFIFALIAAGLIICSQLNNLLLKKYTSNQIVKVTMSVQAIIGLLFVFGTYFNVLNLYSTIVLIACFLSCQGFTFPNASALSMAPFSSNAGSASAIMGAMQMGIAAIASAVVGLLKPESAMPMAATMAACAGLGWFILIFAGRNMEVPVLKKMTEEMKLDAEQGAVGVG